MCATVETKKVVLHALCEFASKRPYVAHDQLEDKARAS